MVSEVSLCCIVCPIWCSERGYFRCESLNIPIYAYRLLLFVESSSVFSCFCGIFQVAAVVKVCYIGRQTSKVKVAFVTRLKHAMQKRNLIQPFISFFLHKECIYCQTVHEWRLHFIANLKSLKCIAVAVSYLKSWIIGRPYSWISISSCIEALMVALFVWIVLFSKLAQLEKFNQAYRAVINTI